MKRLILMLLTTAVIFSLGGCVKKITPEDSLASMTKTKQAKPPSKSEFELVNYARGLAGDYGYAVLDVKENKTTAVYTLRLVEKPSIIDDWFSSMTEGEGLLTLSWNEDKGYWDYSAFEWTKQEYTVRMDQLERKWIVTPTSSTYAQIVIEFSDVRGDTCTVEWDATGDRTTINGASTGSADCTIKPIVIDGEESLYLFQIDGIELDTWEYVGNVGATKQSHYYFRINKTTVELCMNLDVFTTGDINLKRLIE